VEGALARQTAALEFLDTHRQVYGMIEILNSLKRDLGIAWTVHRRWYGWQWAMRPWKARWHSKRPPSNFWILTGRFTA